MPPAVRQPAVIFSQPRQLPAPWGSLPSPSHASALTDTTSPSLRHDPFQPQATRMLEHQRPIGLQVLIELHAVASTSQQARQRRLAPFERLTPARFQAAARGKLSVWRSLAVRPGRALALRHEHRCSRQAWSGSQWDWHDLPLRHYLSGERLCKLHPIRCQNELQHVPHRRLRLCKGNLH
jgi:hypothetical protein